MNSVKITIPGRLPGLNEYIDACRAHRMKGAAMKKAAMEQCMWQMAALKRKGIYIESKIDISRGEMLVGNSPVPLFVVDYTTNEVGTYKITQVADYWGSVKSLKYESMNSSPVDISITVGDFIYSDENTSSDEKTSKLEFIESFSTSVDYTNNGLADIIFISSSEDSTNESPYTAKFSSIVKNGIDILTSRHIFCKKQTETVSDSGSDVTTTVREYSCFLTGSITYSVKCSGYISEEAYKNASLGKYVMDVTVTVTAGA